MISAFLDGEISPSEKEKLFLHLNSCVSCKTFFENLQAIQKEIDSFEPAVPPDNYPKLAASRMIEIITQAQRSSFEARKESPFWLWRKEWLWIGLSLLIIIAGLFLYHQYFRKADLFYESSFIDYRFDFLAEQMEFNVEDLAALNELIEQEIIGLDINEIDYCFFIEYSYFSLEELSDEAKEDLLREMMRPQEEGYF